MIECILIAGGIGSLIFTCFLILMSTTGIASGMRDEHGDFRKGFNWRKLMGGMAFFVLLFGLLYMGNLFYASSLSVKPTFLEFWLNSFGIFMVLHLYDLIILDYLIIVKWHPAFLKLPDTPYYRNFGPHLKGFFRGIPLGILVSFIVSIFSALLGVQ